MMSDTKPRVSVVIPVYNRERYLGEAIDSILGQSFADFELIVVDDGSTDGSCDVVRAYRDPRIRLVHNERNLGIPVTRNRGLEQCRGEYMAILDSDDWAYPRRLDKQVGFLDTHPDHAVVGGWAAWMDDAGRSLGKVKRRPVNADDAAAALIFRSCLQQSAVMGRTNILRRHGYRQEFDMSSDFELWVRLAQRYKIANLGQPLVRYRVHRGRTTRAKAKGVVKSQKAIFAYQLDALGLSYGPRDLERHLQLPRLAKYGALPGADYLDWAEDWLLRLIAANETGRRYPRAAFARVLGWSWCQVCQRAARRGYRVIGQRFWRSPLRGAALSALMRQGIRHTLPAPLAFG